LKLALIQSFLPGRSQGGVGHFTDQLANHLVGRGHRVTVFSLDPASVGARYDVLRPPDSANWSRNRWGRTYGFAAWISKQDYAGFDLVHAMGDNHLLCTRVPVVRTIHGSAMNEALHARKLMTSLMYLTIYPLELVGAARASLAVAVSRDTARHFPWVTTVIPPGIDLQTFRPAGGKSSEPSILAVGHRLKDRKRLDMVVEIYLSSVRPQIRNAQLWLVCDEVVEAAGIRCFSNLPVEVLAELYRRAWLFCLPSAYEGFGLPYAEALASGTPVVSTPNPGAREVLSDGRFGVLTSEQDLAHSLVALLKDADRRTSLARAGLDRAKDFSWERVVSEYESLYETLTPQSSPPGVDVVDEF
jgi:phosphatidyl-myo-inositol alpha-mannosyltransferase